MLNWGSSFSHVYKASDPPEPPQSEQKRIPIKCSICGADTDAEIMGWFISKGNSYIKLPRELLVYNYLLRCTRCNGAMLLMWTHGQELHGQRITAGKRLFPFRTDAFELGAFEDSVPKSIVLDITQAEISFYAGAYLGAGMLFRRACQYICLDKDASGNNLWNQIEDLFNKGLITRALAEMAHNIRIIGNEIAHPNPDEPFVITPDDIKACYEFIKQLIQAIYINPYRANKFAKSLEDRNIK